MRAALECAAPPWGHPRGAKAGAPYESQGPGFDPLLYYRVICVVLGKMGETESLYSLPPRVTVTMEREEGEVRALGFFFPALMSPMTSA